MEIYYVYTHRDPRTNQVRYVGCGSGQRAWMIRNSGSEGAAYGHRSAAHYQWFLGLESLGYTMDQIVVIEARQLGKSEAREMEREIIASLRGEPLFNKQRGSYGSVDVSKRFAANELRGSGLSYKAVAERMGATTMTVWRWINGPKALENCGEK